MTKKQRRKLKGFVRAWKMAAKRNQCASKHDGDYYSAAMAAYNSCAHYLQQFLEGK